MSILYVCDNIDNKMNVLAPLIRPTDEFTAMRTT